MNQSRSTAAILAALALVAAVMLSACDPLPEGSGPAPSSTGPTASPTLSECAGKPCPTPCPDCHIAKTDDVFCIGAGCTLVLRRTCDIVCRPLKVTYWTSDITAKAGEHYVGVAVTAPKEIEFGEGITAVEVLIETIAVPDRLLRTFEIVFAVDGVEFDRAVATIPASA